MAIFWVLLHPSKPSFHPAQARLEGFLAIFFATPFVYSWHQQYLLVALTATTPVASTDAQVAY